MILTKEETVKKRGWVKNAAIIFLAVMLVLTFFSNTIMNRALPEVAAQHASPGTINARIRGNGTVAANDTFEVIVNNTRTVREVNVRLGNEVSVGDLLFTLTHDVSEELNAARRELDALLLTYERAVINASLEGDFDRQQRAIQLARNTLNEAQARLATIPHSATGIADAMAAVAHARAEVAKAEAAVENAELMRETSADYIAAAEQTVATALAAANTAQTGVNTAQTAVTAAQTTVETRVAALRAVQDELYDHDHGGASLTNIDRQISDKMAEIASVNTALAAANAAHGANLALFRSAAQAYFNLTVITPVHEAAFAEAIRTGLANYDTTGIDDDELALLRLAYTTITNLQTELSNLNVDLQRLQENRQNAITGNQADRNQILRRLRDAENALGVANAALVNTQGELAAANNTLRMANAELAHAEAVLASIEAAGANVNTTLRDANAALALEKANLATAQEALEVQQGYRTDWETENANVRTLQQNLENLIFDLSEEQKTAGVTSSLTNLELRNQRSQIAAQRELIESLEDDEEGMLITSPVNGIITQINISPGNQTQSNVPLATIEVVDRGFTVSFSVTVDQSRRIAVGDNATARGRMWGVDIPLVLTSIRNDPQNPATTRILEFDVLGEVESGEQLNITLGERSQQFEVVVPNSALRSDTNGDFVLLVASRPSPLGNRFVAMRMDVMILASDDTHSAVAGGLAAWDFVITTSTRPIEPGMQIRLVDNP